MFGTIEKHHLTVDVEVDTLVGNIAWFASNRMKRYAGLKELADRVRHDTDPTAYLAAINEANRVRDLVRWISLPLRNSIQKRTADEKWAAERAVGRGEVRFLEPPCSGDTCADCDRPLWHHIRVSNVAMLCPFGREFWTYARALVSEREYTMRELHQSVLFDIARRA